MKKNSDLTISELIEYVDYFLSNNKDSKDRIMFSRLKNILRNLSQNYLFAEHITKKEFMSTRNCGKRSWEFYNKIITVVKFQKV